MCISKIGLSPLSLALFVALSILPLLIQDEYILQLLISSLLMGSQAIAFDFTGGLINVVNFGFAAIFGAGAYTSALLVVRLGLSSWVAPIGGAAAAGLLGFLVGILTLRLQG